MTLLYYYEALPFETVKNQLQLVKYTWISGTLHLSPKLLTEYISPVWGGNGIV